MSEKLLRATHQGKLTIANYELSCAVLENSSRIISKSAVFKSFGRTKRGRKKDEIRVPNMPSFIDAKNLMPYINKELRGVLSPIDYIAKNGRQTTGYKAEILPMLCEVYLNARQDGVLTKQQLPLARASEILLKSLSKIGIIGLVDEVTGFQEVRDRLALQKILDKYIAKELQSWAKRFPDDFYKEMFRLRGWQYSPPSVKRPSLVGRLTNNLVYARLAPGVLNELKRISPRDDKGRLMFHYHRQLTPDIGHPKLAEHLAGVITLMKASANWNGFYRLLQRALPKRNETMLLPFEDEDTE